jgi:hypothetical protein
LVQRLDGVGPRHFTELLVHVVCSGARVVTEPDAKVLDLQRAFLVDLMNHPNSTLAQPKIPITQTIEQFLGSNIPH